MASPKLNWNVALAGECMVCRPFAVHDDPASMAVIDLMRNAELTYAHLEMNIANIDTLPTLRPVGPSAASRVRQPGEVGLIRF